MRGRQVLIYLVDGTPDGVRTAEIVNWTGHVVAAPRERLADLLKREEPSRSGVYVLLGEDGDGSPVAYIGEADDVSTRIRAHQRERGWWDRLVVVTSQAQAQQLTKSEVRWLESSLIRLAEGDGRAQLDNGTAPPLPSLSEAVESNMRSFLEQLLVLLPTIGVDIFRQGGRASAARRTGAPQMPAAVPPEGPEARMRVPRHGVDARLVNHPALTDGA